MAYWSSTEYDHYAARSGPHDLRNAKPRWQELAELAQDYPTSSSLLSTATIPTSTRNREQMEHRNRRYNDGRDSSWDRRPRASDSNVASLGASRSRSRSRISRTRTIVTEEFAPRRRSNSPQARGSLGAIWKPAMLISLLALLNNALVWYGDPMFPDATMVRRSFTEERWTSHDESVVERVGHQICRLPVIPKVLDCSQTLESEEPRNDSIHHYLRSIVSAISENPDTVDAILDITEDVKKELIALQKLEVETTQAKEQAVELVQNEGERATPLRTEDLLDLVSLLEADLSDWDSEKDKLLGTMQAQLASLNLEHHQDMVREQFNMAVARNLRDIATSLEHMQSSSLAALNKTLGVLLDDISVPVQNVDASGTADAQIVSTIANRPSTLKRLLLWSLPFNIILPNAVEPTLSPAQRQKIVHDKLPAIHSLLDAIHTSNNKALSAATTANTLMMAHNSWLSNVIFWSGVRERTDENIVSGLKEMKGLVPMIMEQRRGGRADRKYMRSMARTKKAVQEIKAKKEGEVKASKIATRVYSSMRVWERRRGKMEEVCSEESGDMPSMNGEASKAHNKAMDEHEKALEEHNNALEAYSNALDMVR